MAQTIIGVNDPKAVKLFSAQLMVDVARDAAQAEQRALEMRGALAKITKDEATTEKLRAEASGKKIDTKGRALGVAGALAAAIPIAPAADRLLSDDPNAQAGNPAPTL